jgi:hypothetical protein
MEEDEFLTHHWKCLKTYQANGKKTNGVLCLGDYGAYPDDLKSRRILFNLIGKGYLKEYRRVNQEETHPSLEPEVRCFEFTECSGRLAKFLMHESY